VLGFYGAHDRRNATSFFRAWGISTQRLSPGAGGGFLRAVIGLGAGGRTGCGWGFFGFLCPPNRRTDPRSIHDGGPRSIGWAIGPAKFVGPPLHRGPPQLIAGAHAGSRPVSRRAAAAVGPIFLFSSYPMWSAGGSAAISGNTQGLEYTLMWEGRAPSFFLVHGAGTILA